ncbi:MAG: molybdenum cofactor biosynthesis protein MoaE [Nitrospiraceae bacterium]|nr:molybdenum cofactor biosynthesis protein MoaE [Nitrospiraceae bacterium]
MIEQWIKEVKQRANPEELGMILIHNGLVRATSKEGRKIKGMDLSYDKTKLETLVSGYNRKEGVIAIRAWINEGRLNIGDDIMYVLVAGHFRKNVLPVFEALISGIKKDVVTEDEF